MKILITEKQAKYLAESQLADAIAPALPDFVSEKVDKPSNPFINTGYFVHGVLNKFAKERQKEIISNFSDDITSFPIDKIYSKLSKLVTKCIKREEPIREMLEKICCNTVVKIFNIPEDELKLECELLPAISPTKSYHVQPDTDEEYEYDTVNDIDEYDKDTNKRRIINALSYGIAQAIAEQSKELWINEIFNLDEELPHLYSQIMKINEYLVFNTDVKITDKSHKQGGNVEITLSNDENVTSLSSYGVVFPILLQETIRGVVDIIATYGLPDDKQTAERVINIADALENDPWNMRFGPIMWRKVQDGIGKIETSDILPFFKSLVELSAEDFSALMKELFAGTRQGKAKISELYNTSKYNNEYDKFTQDIALRQGRDVIDDDCFTEEELEQGLYNI